ERLIIEQRQEHIRRRMMQERGKLIAGGHACAFPVVGNGFGGNRLRHESTFRDFERTRQGVASELRRRFNNWPRERANPDLGSNFANQAIEFGAKKGTAIENSACFSEEEIRVLQLQLMKNFKNLLLQVMSGRCQKFARRRIAGFGGFRDDRKYLWKDNRGFLPHQVHKLTPFARKRTENIRRQLRLLCVQEFLKAERSRLSPNIVSAAWITDDRSKSACAREPESRSPAQYRGACARDHHETRNLARRSKRKNQVAGDDNRSIGKAGL